MTQTHSPRDTRECDQPTASSFALLVNRTIGPDGKFVFTTGMVAIDDLQATDSRHARSDGLPRDRPRSGGTVSSTQSEAQLAAACAAESSWAPATTDRARSAPGTRPDCR